MGLQGPRGGVEHLHELLIEPLELSSRLPWLAGGGRTGLGQSIQGLEQRGGRQLDLSQVLLRLQRLAVDLGLEVHARQRAPQLLCPARHMRRPARARPRAPEAPEPEGRAGQRLPHALLQGRGLRGLHRGRGQLFVRTLPMMPKAGRQSIEQLISAYLLQVGQEGDFGANIPDDVAEVVFAGPLFETVTEMDWETLFKIYRDGWEVN